MAANAVSGFISIHLKCAMLFLPPLVNFHEVLCFDLAANVCVEMACSTWLGGGYPSILLSAMAVSTCFMRRSISAELITGFPSAKFKSFARAELSALR